MDALGIHEHQQLKLGLRPATPDKVALKLGDYLTGILPKREFPGEVDHLKGLAFGMYQNDSFGVCGPCSVANSRRLITARLKGEMIPPSQEDVFDLYRRSGNPRFDPRTGRDDNGVNMQVMLQAVDRGGIGGVKCLGFARVDAKDIPELEAAIALFGFLLLAVDLQQAQQNQTGRGVWDYRPSGGWGGHAVISGSYAEGIDVITWAKRVRMTDLFVKKQLTEAWVCLWPEHLTDAGFLKGVDLHGLSRDYAALTGRPFPVDVPEKDELSPEDFRLF